MAPIPKIKRKPKPKLKKVLTRKDAISLAFGAAIGWSWVALLGNWIEFGGTLGAILGFILGGVMVFFVGITYSELVSAIPKSGGELEFSMRGLGYNWSFVTSWALALSYLGVVAFEVVAFPLVLENIVPQVSTGYLYNIAGDDIYLVSLLIGIAASLFLTFVNIRGVKFATWVQQLFTLAILIVGGLLIVTGLINGDSANTQPLFANGAQGILQVAVMVPFLLVGFDVIPQTAEEMDVEPKRLAHIILSSIILSTVFYIIVIYSASSLMSEQSIINSNLFTADALVVGMNGWALARYIAIFGGLCGIMSSWNAFITAGSRVLYSMANHKMLPKWFGKIHPKYNTPINSILFIGIASSFAAFFGETLLIWISNVASLSTVIAFGLTALSFVMLRKNEPEMPRPYRVKHGKVKGALAFIACLIMFSFYLPGMPSGLGRPEWTIAMIWTVLGVIAYILTRRRKANFEEEQKQSV